MKLIVSVSLLASVMIVGVAHGQASNRPDLAATKTSIQATTTSVVSTATSARATATAKVGEAKATRVANAIVKCDSIETRINEKITNYQTREEAHVRAYNNLTTRLQKIVDLFASKGYDTSSLEEHLSALETKINNFETDFAMYNERLRNTQQYACGQSEGEFKNALNQSRVQLQAVHSDAEQIRSYYQNTIRADIQSLKNLVATSTATAVTN